MKSIVSAAAAATFALLGLSPVMAGSASAQSMTHFDPNGSAGSGDEHGHNDDGTAEAESESVDPVQEQDGNVFDQEHEDLEQTAGGR